MAMNPIIDQHIYNKHIHNRSSMSPTKIVAYLALLTVASYVVHATDPNQLQDFCVGVNDPKDALFVNGLFCKNPMDAKPEDFFFPGLAAEPRPTNNRVRSNVTTVAAQQLPGLNTLGISLARIDYGPGGLNTPHVHPRATEVLTVLEGTLYVGFVTSNLPNGDNKFFPMLLKKGDVFVFPQGLIHFQLNVGKYPAVALSALSSQNPGVISIADAVFGADPPINSYVLSTAFQLDPKIVKDLQSKFNMMSD